MSSYLQLLNQLISEILMFVPKYLAIVTAHWNDRIKCKNTKECLLAHSRIAQDLTMQTTKWNQLNKTLSASYSQCKLQNIDKSNSQDFSFPIFKRGKGRMKFHYLETKSCFTFQKGSINEHLLIFYPIPRTVEKPRELQK